MLTYEPAIRLGLFLAIFGILAVWELASPRRVQRTSRRRRWPGNLAIVAIDTLLVRLLLPTSLVGMAMIAESSNWGLLNVWTAPLWLSFIASILILDLIIYLQHVLFHAVPALWRVHRMHHADLDFDVSTGTRFHPIEILLSVVIKMAAIVALGIPAIAVFTFEVLLSATAMFNHSNALIPKRWDKILRWIVVTPDMHRVHHSIAVCETNSNFGFNLPWWDRMFGTYRDQPADGHLEMKIGINQFRDPKELRLDKMLTQPFREGVGEYSMSRGGDDA